MASSIEKKMIVVNVQSRLDEGEEFARLLKDEIDDRIKQMRFLWNKKINLDIAGECFGMVDEEEEFILQFREHVSVAEGYIAEGIEYYRKEREVLYQQIRDLGEEPCQYKVKDLFEDQLGFLDFFDYENPTMYQKEESGLIILDSNEEMSKVDEGLKDLEVILNERLEQLRVLSNKAQYELMNFQNLLDEEWLCLKKISACVCALHNDFVAGVGRYKKEKAILHKQIKDLGEQPKHYEYPDPEIDIDLPF